jgi:Dolichyl-phosphate-mannose-protein mannosyltransferase
MATAAGRTGLSIARALLASAVTAYLIRPIVLSSEKSWLTRSSRVAGAALALASAAFLAFEWRRARRVGTRVAPGDAGLAIVTTFFAALTGNGVCLTSGDNRASRHIPFQVVEHATVALDGVAEYRADPGHYSVGRFRGRLLSTFPLGTPLLAVPVAAAMRVLGTLRESDDARLVDRLEKYTGALLTSTAAFVLFLGLRRRFGDAPSLLGAAVFAFSTTAFTTAGQSLSSHTGELLCLASALALLLGERESRPEALCAGLLVGAAFLCRPTALLVAGALAFAVARSRRKDVFVFLLGAAASTAAAIAWLHSVYGVALGGYGSLNGSGAWSRSPLEGLVGTLVSPSRGLFVFQPYLLFLPLLVTRREERLGAWRDTTLLVFASIWILVGCYAKWWGGHSFGPRLFTETAPFAALAAALCFEATRARARMRVALAASVVFAASTEVLGAYRQPAAWWNGLVKLDEHPEVLWNVRDGQLAAAWIPRWRYRDPAAAYPRADVSIPGNLDSPADGAIVAGTIELTGWCQERGGKPCVSVGATVDGERVVPVSVERFARPDVEAVVPGIGPAAKAGFRITVERPSSPDGPHEIAALGETVDGRRRVFRPARVTWRSR